MNRFLIDLASGGKIARLSDLFGEVYLTIHDVEVTSTLDNPEPQYKITATETCDLIKKDLNIPTSSAPRKPHRYIPDIKNVIYNDPATIVFWSDGTKTVVKCGEGDDFDPEKGLAMAISKKALGNQGNYYNTFTKWVPEEELTLEQVESILAGFRYLAKKFNTGGDK